MDYGSEAAHGKSKVLVIGLVLLGMALLATGAIVALMRGPGAAPDGAGASVTSDEIKGWCELRRSWAQQIDAMSADIALKSVRAEDADERTALVRKRDDICRDFGKQVEAMKLSDPRVIEVEKALIKEGKVRANIAVEISNVLAKVPEDPGADAAVLDVGKRIEELRDGYESLQERVSRRIRTGEAQSDREVSAALSQLQGCSGIYRGPMTDMGTSGTPYVSWKELELERKRTARLLQERVRLLEPREQYANHVYHEIVRKYGDTFSKCYAKARRKNPDMSSQLRLQVRLSKRGRVQSMAIREMAVPEELLIDCLLETAIRWRLPAPATNGEVVVLPIELTALQ